MEHSALTLVSFLPVQVSLPVLSPFFIMALPFVGSWGITGHGCPVGAGVVLRAIKMGCERFYGRSGFNHRPKAWAGRAESMCSLAACVIKHRAGNTQ